MNIINIGFTAINANRNGLPKGTTQTSTNIKIDSVEETKLGIDDARGAYKVLFSFKTEYSPNLATIEIKGEVLVLDSLEQVSKTITQWNKEKKLDVDSARAILNNVMNKCSFELLLMSRELGLPSPIPLPRLNSEGAAPAKSEKTEKVEKPVSKPKKK